MSVVDFSSLFCERRLSVNCSFKSLSDSYLAGSELQMLTSGTAIFLSSLQSASTSFWMAFAFSPAT